MATDTPSRLQPRPPPPQSTTSPQAMSESNVQVAVRCRPLNDREKSAGRPSIVLCKPNSNEIAIQKRKTYSFDKVYGQYSTQKDVFRSTVKPVVDEALAGYNCTVFAYGQTGTGKTHTMQGNLAPDDDLAGIIPRSVRYIFDVLQANYQEYSVKVSFLQLYNEELKDLLAPESKKLRLMEDVKRGGIYCQNLLEVTTTTASHVFELLETGVKNRITSETLMNENSSRSHSIFTIRIHSKENNPVGGEDLLKIGQLNLVDLAGSECVGRSGARNVRAREAGNINQSLLTLGRVITALVDNHPHIPYRDSKLTRLLQESLGGRAKTTIIATLAPCADSIDETLSTLEYAYRAKNIKNKPEVNQKMTKSGLLKEYGSEIESLRNALQAARAKDGIFLPPAQFTEMQERLAGQAAQIAELEDELESRSKACKELEEQVDQQKERLDVLERANKDLENKLADREAELVTTKADLESTRADLKEAKRVLSLYQTNEQVLLHRGGQATSLFRESEHRVDSLLEKVSRKQQVEDSNHELADSFAQSSLASLVAFEHSLKDHQTQHGNLTNDMEAAIAALKSKHDENINALQTALDSLNTLAQKHKSDSDAALAREREKLNEDVSKHQGVLSKQQEASNARLEEFVQLTEDHTARLMRQLASSSEAQQSHWAEIGDCLKTSRSHMSQFLNDQCRKLTELKSSLDSALAGQATQLADHKKALIDALRVGQSKQRDQLEAMKTQLTQLIQDSIETHSRHVDDDVQMVSAHAESQQQQLSSAREMMGEEISAVTTQMGEAENAQQVQFTSLQSRIATIRQNEENTHRNLTTTVSGLKEERTSWNERCRNVQKETFEELSRLVCAQHATHNENIDTAESRAKTHETAQQVAVAHGQTCVETTTEDTTEHISGIKRKLGEVSSWASTILKESANFSKTQEVEIQSWIKMRKVDTPTGSTPVKVSPEFPKFEATKLDDTQVGLMSPTEECRNLSTTFSEELISPSTGSEAASSAASEPNEPAPEPTETTFENAEDTADTAVAAELKEKNTQPPPGTQSGPSRQSSGPKVMIRKRTLSGNGLRGDRPGGSSIAPPRRYRQKHPMGNSTNKH